MTNRFLVSLIVFFSFSETKPPAGGVSGPATPLDMQSTDTSGAIILVRKGKGHGDGEERFERHHETRGFSRYRRHSHGVRGFHGYRGFGHHSGSGGGNQNQPDGQN